VLTGESGEGFDAGGFLDIRTRQHGEMDHGSARQLEQFRRRHRIHEEIDSGGIVCAERGTVGNGLAPPWFQLADGFADHVIEVVIHWLGEGEEGGVGGFP
jgi:hypothetical protein